jgi:hypothetical protein
MKKIEDEDDDDWGGEEGRITAKYPWPKTASTYC